jgi:hypothetical protein
MLNVRDRIFLATGLILYWWARKSRNEYLKDYQNNTYVSEGKGNLGKNIKGFTTMTKDLEHRRLDT